MYVNCGIHPLGASVLTERKIDNSRNTGTQVITVNHKKLQSRGRSLGKYRIWASTVSFARDEYEWKIFFFSVRRYCILFLFRNFLRKTTKLADNFPTMRGHTKRGYKAHTEQCFRPDVGFHSTTTHRLSEDVINYSKRKRFSTDVQSKVS